MKPRPSFRTVLLLGAALASAPGCQGCLGLSTSPLDNPDSTLPRSCQSDQPLIQPQKLDILFVIDNSNSMREEQEAVARELTDFIAAIKTSGGVSQDFHVGVITTSVYQHSLVAGYDVFREYPEQSGKLQPVPDAAADGGVVLGTGTERMLSGDDPDLIAKFSRLVRQGTSGSGQETPYEAVRLAMVSDLATTPMAQGGNQEFFRDGARLLVVVLSDEDDCSETARPSQVTVGDDPLVDDCADKANLLTPVSDYFTMFSQAKDSLGHTREIIWTEIAPVGISTKQVQAVIEGGQVRNIDCPTSNAPGFRHKQMSEMWDPSLANLDSICKASFHDTLLRIAELAAVSQTISVKNVPDPHMLQVEITRADGSTQKCTLLQGLKAYEPPASPGEDGRILFDSSCLRRADDQAIAVRLLCAT